MNLILLDNEITEIYDQDPKNFYSLLWTNLIQILKCTVIFSLYNILLNAAAANLFVQFTC